MTHIANKTGNTGNFLPVAIVKIKTVNNNPKVRKRIQGFVKNCGISKLLMCSLFLIM
jgi:hypothetical protein